MKKFILVFGMAVLLMFSASLLFADTATITETVTGTVTPTITASITITATKTITKTATSTVTPTNTPTPAVTNTGRTGESYAVSVDATTSKKLIITGKYTVFDVQMLHSTIENSLTKRFYLLDAANTWENPLQTLTFTATDIPFLVGKKGSSFVPGNGVYYGIEFTRGVVIYGGTDGDGGGSITATVKVKGR